MTDPLNKSTHYEYDLNGNETKVTSPNGNKAEFGYNAVDRNTSISHNGTKRYSFEYDPNGNVTKETDHSGNEVTAYTYDEDNKLKTINRGSSNKTDYTYDKNGNITEQAYTASSAIFKHTFAYNALDQLIRVTEDGKNRAWFTYDEGDRIASRKNGDGTVTLFQYNGAGDLVEQIILDKQGELLDKFTYSYDNKGNITGIKSAAGTTQYVYDSLDQLTKETRPDGTIYEYTYDATGNRLTQKVTKGSDIKTTTYTYDDADQLTAVGGKNQTYDDNGNLTKDGERTYVYDAENRLTAVKDKDGNTIASFTYRADGMRKTMTTGSKTITFHYDENKNVTHETDGNNQVIASYTYTDDQPISMTRGGKTYYYQTNYRGDVVALTDSAGAMVATYEYDAYGNLLKETGSVENPYRYAGYRYDKEPGLYYLQSRYYNPETGRFLTRDTFGGVDIEPLSQIKYTYAHNNPIMNTDHSGFAVPAVVAVALKYIASTVGWTLLSTATSLAITTRSFNPRKWGAKRFAKHFAFNLVWNLVPGGGLRKIGTLWRWTNAIAYSYGLRFHFWLIGKVATARVIKQLVKFSLVQTFKRVMRNKFRRWRR